jgi:hypothetical protein
MATKPVSAEVYTRYHRILGRLDPGPKGLYGFLNIPTQSYVEMAGAHINRLHQPGRLIARYSKLWLVKREIQVVLLSSRAELGATGTIRRGYSHPAQHQVQVMLEGYELHGTLETVGKFDFGMVMFEGDHVFAALYDADLSAILFSDVRAHTPAMLFNRGMVDSMALAMGTADAEREA